MLRNLRPLRHCLAVAHGGRSERQNPLTLYTIYYIDGAVGGGHLTPKLVGFLDPLDREFFEAFTTVPGVGFMRALKCLVRPDE